VEVMVPAAARWRLQAHLPQPHAQRLRCKVELEGTRALLVVGGRMKRRRARLRLIP
jgi:hypothetical protein